MKMRSLVNRGWAASAVVGLVALGIGWALGSATADQTRPEKWVYELRTYTTHPGKLPDLHKRFREHTMRIFEKHGMRNVAYWTPVDEKLKDNTLVYLIAHRSLEAAEKSWAAFRDDPEWKRVFAKSRENGPIVKKVQRQFLIPTDYSPMK